MPPVESSRRKAADRLAEQDRRKNSLSWSAKEILRERVQICQAFLALGKTTSAMRHELRGHLFRNAARLRELGYGDLNLTFDPKRIIALYGAVKTVHKTRIRRRDDGKVTSVTRATKDQAIMVKIRAALKEGR